MKLSRIKKIFLITLTTILLFGCGDSGISDNKSDGYYDNGYSENINSGLVGNQNYGDSIENSNNSSEYEQKIITNADLSIETKDFDKTLEIINNSIAENKGYTQSSNIRKHTSYNNGGELRYADIVVRIPADKLNVFLNAAETSGNVVSSGLDSDDITTQYYDLQADIKSLEAQEERLQELYDKAKTINELISIEERLSNVRNQINKKKTLIQNYDLLTKYSTVTITIEEVEVLTETSNNFLSVIGTAFKESLVNFKDYLIDLIVLLIYAAPFILLYGAIIGIVVLAIKKQKYKKSIKKEENKENK